MRETSRLLSVSRSVSLPAKLIESTTPAITIPMIRTTIINSSSVKPPSRGLGLTAALQVAARATPESIREIPIADIGGCTVAAGLTVGAQRVEVIRLAMRAWIGVLVGTAPGIFGEPLDVRAVPMRHRRVVRLLDERVEPVVRRRIL